MGRYGEALPAEKCILSSQTFREKKRIKTPYKRFVETFKMVYFFACGALYMVKVSPAARYIDSKVSPAAPYIG